MDSGWALAAEVEQLRATNDWLRDLLALWLDFAPADALDVSPGPNRKTLGELTRAALDDHGLDSPAPDEGAQ